MPTGRDRRGFFVIRLDTTGLNGKLETIHQLYNTFFPDNPFDHFFLGEYIKEQYQSDETFGAILSFFSAMAMLILALGLFGLSLFTTARRAKEMAIRKVFGAGVGHMIRLLLRDAVILLLAAFIIALPLLIGVLNRWLEQYAERIRLHAGLFLWPLLIVLLVTILTILWQTWRSTTAPPTDSLKDE
ncbi:MAG: FtsX-like permease family protein [Acidobacteria bacterium]|nr:FtsX-like permease family protein [Acidobacteriota bacterium]